MNTVSLLAERVTFSLDMPDEVNRLLQLAVAATQLNPKQAEALFLQAQALDSQCLQSYFALYKFYFFQKRLADAERFVQAGLEEAARQGGFPSDYRRLVQELAKWDCYASEIKLFYLYTLKALAFIKLRQGCSTEAHRVLSHIKQLDPKDLSGASVIMDLAEGVSES